ncbi:hypothetical protein EW026_g3909 [Hermanssonia centrifuga]|uniref:Protein kinase domain-containing protein n=1 Tax=Hermanssonia centrifuga TaxID=98765 RepID=A0A4V6S0Y6_9APHY|nr:hypothetical protein EW026_g3909 [Hermanssonia centrifuga]
MPKSPRQRSVSPRAEPYPKSRTNVAQRKLERTRTLLVMRPECLVDAKHEKKTVNPYIQEDVDNARREPLRIWVEAVLGLPPEQFSEWVRYIKENEWYKDEVIQEGLIGYGKATTEKGLYVPFTDIANRIIRLGKDGLPGAKPYPLDGIAVVENDDNYLKQIPEHQGIGALRRPDLLAVRVSKALQMQEDNRKSYEWSDILTFFELKFSKSSFNIFQASRRKRGLPKLDKRTLLPEVPSEKKTVAGTRMTLRARPMVKVLKYSAEKGFYREINSEPEDADDIDVDDPHDEDYSDPGSPEPVRDNQESVRADAKLQAGGYALETVSCSYGTRLFNTGVIMDDDRMSLWYYDAAGIIRTKVIISLFRNFEEFAAILVGFACCTPSQWGSLPPNIIKPPRFGLDPEVFPPKNLSGYTFPITLPKSKEEILATLQKPVFTQYSLVGRRTFLYVIKTNSRKLKKPMVAKFSYQVTSRMREQDIIKVARDAGVGHLPEVHMWADYWKMSEGVRAIFHARSGVDKDFEDRVFRCIVYTQYFPLRDLFSKSCELIPTMVYQMLDCLHDLRYKAKILHRDISANNVMWEKQGDEVVFKLIDFDYATAVDDEGRPASMTAGSKHRTGTLPFMAYALIIDMVGRSNNPFREPLIHMLCHDVESLYYLSGYSLVTMPDMEIDVKRVMYRKTVSAWEDGTLDAISAQKMHFLQEDRVVEMLLPPQSESLRPWLLRFCEVFKVARDKFAAHRKAGSSKPFDLETMGGALSRDAVVSALKGEERIIFSNRREKVVVHPEAFGSGAPNLKTAEGTTNEGKAEAKKSAPAKRAPAKKAPKKDTEGKKSAPAKRAPANKKDTEGKKTATAKTVTPKKMAAAKASQVKDIASKAKLAAAPEVVTIQGPKRRGPTTRSMTKKALAAA